MVMDNVGTGLAAQFGYAKEPAFGTLTTPTDFLEFVNESLAAEENRIESSATGRKARVQRTNRWAPGSRTVGGSVDHELATKGMAPILETALGSVTVTGEDTTGDAANDTWHHEVTPGPLRDKSLTLQVGRPRLDGTIQPFTYTGCQITELGLSAALDEIVTLSATYSGADEDLAEPLASAVFPADDQLFTYVHGTLLIGGVEVFIASFNLNLSNALAVDRRAFGQRVRREGLENGLRDYTGDFDAEFQDLSLYNLYRDGAEAALDLTFDGPGTAALRIEANVRVDGSTPSVDGTDEIRQPISFKCIDNAEDPATALKITYSTDSDETV